MEMFYSISSNALRWLQMGNKGAFIRFEAPDMKPNIVTFSAVVSDFYLEMTFYSLIINTFILISFNGLPHELFLPCYHHNTVD